MSKWEEKQLGELIRIKHGFAFSGDYIIDSDNGVVLVTPGNFKIGGGFKQSGKKFYSGEFSKEYVLKKKSLIVTMTDLSKNADTLGYAAYVPDDEKIYLHNQRIGLVSIISDEIIEKFLYWLLRTPWYQRRIANTSSGTNVKHTSPDRIYKYKFMLPEKGQQERIADILSAYDDLIEANNRRIELLEQAAQDLYKEWFVRFRFPGHEKAKFENGLPEGWELKKIGDIAHVKSGYAFKSEWWIDEGVPVVKIKDIQGNTIDFGDLSHVSEEHAEIAKQFYIVEGDLLIAMTGATIGKLALVPYSERQMVVNQRVGKFFLNENPTEKVAFLYMTLQQNWVQELIVMIAGSNAAQPNISPFDIEKIKVIYNKDLVDEYNRKSTPFIKQILQLLRQNKNLAAQRDLLLPRLMSGKLEV